MPDLGSATTGKRNCQTATARGASKKAGGGTSTEGKNWAS